MKNSPIIIVPGEIESIFFEILFKSLRLKNFSSPLLIIASSKIIKSEMKKFKFKKKIKLVKKDDLKDQKLNNKNINLIDIDFNLFKNKKKTDKINNYIKECFLTAFNILKSGYSNKFINGPINKQTFLNKKFLGMTEFISKKFKIKKTAMLIYNNDISVCPITTHLPLKLVASKINKNIIKEKALLINDFYLKKLGYKPHIAVTGLNPHCETILKFSEDNKIIRPAIKELKKKGIKINGPLPADTIFLKQNLKNYDVIIGMYHDQVLSPIKALKEYDAINITIGLPFYRLSPDHGPNKKMINKNLSNPISLIKALQFLDKR